MSVIKANLIFFVCMISDNEFQDKLEMKTVFSEWK